MWSCLSWVFYTSYNYGLCDQNKCFYAIFIMNGNTWNGLGFDHDPSDLNLSGFNLSLLCYNCDYVANHEHMKLNDCFGSYDGD